MDNQGSGSDLCSKIVLTGGTWKKKINWVG